MPVDISGFATVYPSSESLARDNQSKRPPPVESGQERSVPQRNQVNRDVIERKVNARAETSEVNVERFRDTQELPRQTQSALQTYQSTEQNDYDSEGGELVGVDIFV